MFRAFRELSIKVHPLAFHNQVTDDDEILLMEEILHHLGWLKPYK